MLIKIDENHYEEFPDQLGVFILADPSYSDDFSNFSPYQVNILLHGTLGALYDYELSVEENISKILKEYESLKGISTKNKDNAIKLIDAYNKIPIEQIGVADINDVF